MKLLCVLIMLLLSVPLRAEDVPKVIDRLPTVREKILRDTAKLSEGSTMEMVEAMAKMRTALLPSLVSIEAELNKETEKATLQLIERDLEAIARDAHIRGHAKGWGGTVVKVEAAVAVVEHIESRISWCVWQLMQDTKEFNFDAWLNRWTDKSEQEQSR
jgi:hypothetical protein